MYKYISKPVGISIVLLYIGMCSVSFATEVSMEELRKAIVESKIAVNTAHIIYIEDHINNEQIKLKSTNDPVRNKLVNINKNYTYEADTIFNCIEKKAKSVRSDLRDVNTLLKANDIPEDKKVSISMDKTILYRDNYEMVMTYFGYLYIEKLPGVMSYIFDIPYFGVIDINLLDNVGNPRITETILNGSPSILVEITRETPGGTINGKIKCDPKLNYRFQQIQWSHNGNLLRETVADDYRDVNGIPYPFSYIYRQFGENGEIRNETSYIVEEAKFNLPLNKDDFKIYIPPNTDLEDSAISKKAIKIGIGRFMDVDDAIQLGRNVLQAR